MRDQHVVVTGGGSGIGAAVAEGFKQSGATVTIVGRNAQRLSEFAASHDLHFEVADVSDEESVKESFVAIASKSGPITILVNNAGAADAMPFVKSNSDHWMKMIGVNLNGVYFCSQAVLSGMLEQGAGRIINIASTAALRGYAYVAAYCAAKHGVLGLTRALALELAKKGITVNAICPGYTDTDIVSRSVEKIVAATGRTAEEAVAELVKSNPQGRLIRPEEVATTALWLASNDAASITGQAIAVAGGEVM